MRRFFWTVASFQSVPRSICRDRTREGRYHENTKERDHEKTSETPVSTALGLTLAATVLVAGLSPWATASTCECYDSGECGPCEECIIDPGDNCGWCAACEVFDECCAAGGECVSECPEGECCVGGECESCEDCNGNGLPDECDLDCMATTPGGSSCDLPGCGGSLDNDGNGIPDECEGWVLRWAVLGPFDGDDLEDHIAGGCGYTERNIDPSAGNKTQGKTWEAQDAVGISSGRGIDFEARYGGAGSTDNRNAYAHTYIYTPTGRQVRALVGSDDSFELYLDGSPAASYSGGPRPTAPDDTLGSVVHLEKGWHRVLVQLKNGSQDATWNFVLRFDDGDSGSPTVLTDLTVTPQRGEIPDHEGLVVPEDPAARPPAVLDWLILGASTEGPFEGSGQAADCGKLPANCMEDCENDLDVLAANGGGAQENAAPTLSASPRPARPGPACVAAIPPRT